MRRPSGFLIGLTLGLTLSAPAIWAQVQARVTTNGELTGYIVQKDGVDVCRDPMVWNDFRSTASFIVCP